jgi:NADH:ubiquinone reductase (H+-translocating)
MLLNQFLIQEYEARASGVKSMHIAIIGAGATGVELAAELRLASRELPTYGLSHLAPDDVKISVIEAADRILPALPERLSKAAHRELNKLGIDVKTGAKVVEVQEGRLCLSGDQTLEADVIVWAAGIKAPELLRDLGGLETNRLNQLVVDENLQTTRDLNIFSFGDCAACPQPNSERPVPPRAQAAHQQASTLTKTLVRRLNGQEPVPFRYRDHGSLISFSQYGTVGNLMGNLTGGSLMVEGRLARLFYISLYRMHQVALHGLIRTGLIWLTDKINRALKPRLKLH